MKFVATMERLIKEKLEEYKGDIDSAINITAKDTTCIVLS